MTQGISWIFDLAKDNISPALIKAKQNFDALAGGAKRSEASIQSAYNNINQSVGKFQLNNSQMLNAIDSQVGTSMGSIAPMLTNPYVLGAAAVAGTTAALWKATKAASEFENNFKQLRDLNLGKTDIEINALRDTIIKLGMDTGLSLQSISTGFFDIQSLTGKYGKDVEEIVSTTGKFARAVDADINGMIAGAGKAMKNFKGLGVDDFLRSNFATFQTAKVNYNELTQVQGEFLGSAAAAGQTLDSANKVFAVFTGSTKNAEQAANMTKVAFQALTDADFSKTMSAIGVKTMDAHHNMLPLQQIMQNMVPVMKQLNDQQFGAVIKAVGGNEGIKVLLQQAKSNGDELLRTFGEFEKAKDHFNYAEIIKNGNYSLEQMSAIIHGQINAGMVMLGEQLLPSVIAAMTYISDKIHAATNYFSHLNAHSVAFRLAIKGAEEAFKLLVKYPMMIWQWIGYIIEKATELFDKVFGGIEYLRKLVGLPIKMTVDSGSGNMFGANILQKVKGTGTATADKSLIPESKFTNVNMEKLLSGSNSKSGELSQVAGGGSQVKNITINIAKQIGIETLVTTSVKEGTQDIKKALEEILTAAIRDTELAVN